VTGRSANTIAGTHDAGEAYDEVAGNRDNLDRLLGKPPRYFRSGTAHYDEVAARIVADLGERPIGFDVNGDQGATLLPGQVEHAMSAATPGSIVIGHFNHPEGGTARGMAAAIRRLTRSGLRFVHLSEYL
jgi:peptidoglycan/xylan/chitin deacetylase (PgdA/CDA1 family)